MATHHRCHAAVHSSPKKGSAASKYHDWKRWLASVRTATMRTPGTCRPCA